MKTLVIIGGSLGSKRINQLIEKQKEFILKSGIQICGNVDHYIIVSTKI